MLAVGAAVQGRVVGHAPGFAFVDVGASVPGVLKVKASLVEGSLLPVRVVVPARGDKGAELKAAEAVMDAPEPVALWWQRYAQTVTQILVSPARELLRLQRLLPAAPFAAADPDPFASLAIDEAIEAALAPVAPFAGGGRLIIEPTAPAIRIDIDGGPLPPPPANAAAILSSRIFILLLPLPSTRRKRTRPISRHQGVDDPVTGCAVASIALARRFWIRWMMKPPLIRNTNTPSMT